MIRRTEKPERTTKRKPGRRFGRFSVAVTLLLLVGVAAMVLLSFPNGRRVIDAAFTAGLRIDRQVRLQMGLPLRGTPDLARFSERLAAKGMGSGAPVFIRIFKKESELELWMKKGNRFALFATYPICRWSGRLGPKLKEGDKQSPEGFYTVSSGQLNPNSRYHRSFNLGFPNVLDRAHGRTGSYLMVHGGCDSIGCYAMTNPVIDEIWHLVTAALKGGQSRFHVHVYPFRMTAWNMMLHGGGEWGEFWRDLKKGHDLFETAHVPPAISFCSGRYVAREGKPGSRGSQPIRENCTAQLSKS